MTVLRARLLNLKQEEEREKYAANRRKQIGTGDRSERIRTYNFPQSRMTDHRIGHSTRNLTEIMDGGLNEVLDAEIALAEVIEGKKFAGSELDEAYYYYKKAMHEGQNYDVQKAKVQRIEKAQGFAVDGFATGLD